MRDIILPEVMLELMYQVPAAALYAVGTVGEISIAVMDDALRPNGAQMVPERLNVPDMEVNQLFPDRRSSGNHRSWLGGNGHLHRSTALLDAGFDLCGIRQDGFAGYLIAEHNGFSFCRNLLPDTLGGERPGSKLLQDIRGSLKRHLDTEGNSLFKQFISTSPGERETQRIGKGPKCTATAFAFNLKHLENQSPSGGSQDPGTPSLTGVLIYPACGTKYMLSGTPIPSKLKRPDAFSDPVCKVVISFLAGNL
jgi:hypothetical protein